nr:WRKY transcription factor 70 [Calotropis procera]
MNPQGCPSQKKLLEERLQKGKEAATQLQTLLRHKLSALDNDNNNSINHGSVVPAVQMLAVQILRSFTESLSVLGPNEILSSHQIVAADGPTRDCSSNRSTKTTAAGQRKKIKTTRSVGVKDRRGSYKRRNVSESWIKLSSNKEDEYAWRKYGQKEIQNTKFPRCYYRCTRKNDQGCKATKQVQRIKQDPVLYQTTYFGPHTCKRDMIISIPPPLNLEHSSSSSSCLLSFNNQSKINNIISSEKRSSDDGILILDAHSDVSDDDNNNNNKSSSLLLEYSSATTTSSWLQELMTTSAGSREHPAPSLA